MLRLERIEADERGADVGLKLVEDGKARTSNRLTRHMRLIVEEGAKYFKSHETGIVGWEGRRAIEGRAPSGKEFTNTVRLLN
jgi:hypothetical protein